jgi:hypothetical protein
MMRGEVYGAVVTEVFSYPLMKALIMHFTGGKKLTALEKTNARIATKVCKRSWL